MAPKLLLYQKPPPPPWVPKVIYGGTPFDNSIIMDPPPPIPEELHGRARVLYGFEISDKLMAEYRERHGIEIPDTISAVIIYKFALLKTFAQEMGMDFVTWLSEKPRFSSRTTRPNQEDMVFWAAGKYGQCMNSTCPSPDVLRKYIQKLGVEMEPAWH
ncbi:hypothetical protein L226DRAFT_531061 [Lentinus tigrinus ALCF2SS1-7]|nr:hypothetical protein L226DRAFT_531061 [Lentinus tigrinus ALCF2SS1-7]